jgi:hypothetical protein
MARVVPSSGRARVIAARLAQCLLEHPDSRGTRVLSSEWARRGVRAPVGGRSLASGHGYDESRWVTGPEADRDRSASIRMQATVFVAVSPRKSAHAFYDRRAAGMK